MSRSHVLLTLTSLLGGVAACADDQPTTNDYEQAAQVLGSLSANVDAGDVHALLDAQLLGQGGMPSGFTLNAQGQIGGASAGVTYAFMLECRDVNNAIQTKCGQTTDSADVDVQWTGDLSLPHLTASAVREGHVHLADLTSNLTTVDGGGSFTLDASLESWLQPRTTDLHFEITSDYDQLHLSKSPARLVDGTIHYTVEATTKTTNRAPHSFTIDAVLTVTQTLLGAQGTLVLDGSQTFAVDLQTGRIWHP